MADELAGKVALVTGGGSGIGRAAALAFARAGARVVVADTSVQGGEETLRRVLATGGEAIFVPTNVAQAQAVEALVATAVATYGRLDCAFNNAGINEEHGPLTECPEELWERTLAVNLKGIFLCMKYEIPAMLAGGGGAIVNTSSVVGLQGTTGVPAYVASKHGIIGLTRAAALDHGPDGIRINAVCPGTIRTGMYEQRLGNNPEADARHAARVPLRRLGQPEDVAGAVIWLCSEAAAFVTGHALVVDGGDLA